MKESRTINPAQNAIRTFLLVLVAVIVYAYAIDVTNVNLQTPTEPRRQASLINVIRLLARPDVLAYDTETAAVTGFSDASHVTFERIIETVLMALIASTVGTILAVPVSFIAARNLMIHVSSPLAAIMAALAALPLGAFVVGGLANMLMAFAAQISAPAWSGIAAVVISVALAWLILRLGTRNVASGSRVTGLATTLGLALATLLLFFSLAVLVHLGLIAGRWLIPRLGAFGFVGNFFFITSDFFRLLAPPLLALAGALIAASLGSRYGQEAVLRLEGWPARLLTAVLTLLGTAVFIYGIGSALNWLYLFDNPQNWTTIPAAVGGVAASVLALLMPPKKPFAIGFMIYTIVRGVLNTLRSIEPIILGIIFVIWAGLGPFAGILALALHSIAALGKLFSEQVESIAEGPVEAITATGANRIQTIVYAVIPQIIPPYIAFTLYRWDINVRLSTIIGFVGGGGIGFVLQQNILLLRYRQASVMMFAIAIVVASLDYVSSKVRSRII